MPYRSGNRAELTNVWRGHKAWQNGSIEPDQRRQPVFRRRQNEETKEAATRSRINGMAPVASKLCRSPCPALARVRPPAGSAVPEATGIVRTSSGFPHGFFSKRKSTCLRYPGRSGSTTWLLTTAHCRRAACDPSLETGNHAPDARPASPPGPGCPLPSAEGLRVSATGSIFGTLPDSFSATASP